MSCEHVGCNNQGTIYRNRAYWCPYHRGTIDGIRTSLEIAKNERAKIIDINNGNLVIVDNEYLDVIERFAFEYSIGVYEDNSVIYAKNMLRDTIDRLHEEVMLRHAELSARKHTCNGHVAFYNRLVAASIDLEYMYLESVYSTDKAQACEELSGKVLKRRLKDIDYQIRKEKRQVRNFNLKWHWKMS